MLLNANILSCYKLNGHDCCVLQVTGDDIRRIEEETRKQSSSPHWFEEREWRITASRFGDISHMTDRRDRLKLSKSLTSRQILSTQPILHGKIYENVAIEQFEKETGHKVEKCGLFVDEQHPYLAASPDGLVGKEFVVEVKCPYNGLQFS